MLSQLEKIKELRTLMDKQNQLKKQVDELKEELLEELRDAGPIELPRELKPYRSLEVQTAQRSGFVVEATSFEILKWGRKKPKKKS